MPMMGPADEEVDLGVVDAAAAAILCVGLAVTTAVAVMGTIEVRDCVRIEKRRRRETALVTRAFIRVKG